MKLLVTGGAGYIGSVATTLLLEAGHDVTVVDDLSTGHGDAVPPAARLIPIDVRRVSEVLHPGSGFDGVLHFAAKSLVAESVERPELYWDTNVGGTLALLLAMRDASVPRLVFSSSAATYGQPATLPITEDAETRPTNPYGASKLAVDQMIGSFATAYGLSAVSLRYFNVAGAYGAAGERHAVETHLIPNALAAAAGGHEPLQVFGDDYPTADGTCVRDYVHVVDLVAAHVLALDEARAGQHRVINLGSGCGFSVREVIDTVQQVTGRPVPVKTAPRRTGDPAALVASNAVAINDLGWRPVHGDLHRIVSDAWAFLRSRAA
jgi:UDP-glucose 4-epimerase